MSKLLCFIHLRKNISIAFAATYLALSCSTAQAISSQTTSSSLDLKSTIAQSQCTRWDVGRFTAIQSNTPEPLHFNLFVRDRDPNRNDGSSARYVVGNVKYGNAFGEVINPVINEAFFMPFALSFRVRWNNGTTGLYQARIDSNGYLSGTTRDDANTNSRADWSVRKPFKCLQR
jgi:hypothetical protein